MWRASDATCPSAGSPAAVCTASRALPPADGPAAGVAVGGRRVGGDVGVLPGFRPALLPSPASCAVPSPSACPVTALVTGWCIFGAQAQPESGNAVGLSGEQSAGRLELTEGAAESCVLVGSSRGVCARAAAFEKVRYCLLALGLAAGGRLRVCLRLGRDITRVWWAVAGSAGIQSEVLQSHTQVGGVWGCRFVERGRAPATLGARLCTSTTLGSWNRK